MTKATRIRSVGKPVQVALHARRHGVEQIPQEVECGPGTDGHASGDEDDDKRGRGQGSALFHQQEHDAIALLLGCA
eukprot:CAMPEP_0181247668 /NCGR_PEP_ID=MMETSP1096-20121128/44738_1 /TAXON_ID=156174 ORGANISM="Chrysochromulina ericina, Strain CCMP281" /NCGR_SAMPLE_ID=MMETSP1096 /ASSEMBLY_ACC=CAM_ASM_000453 /LENGTH=75 /DNA_ID=CAMNT_0023344743 /DNA_START=387 /DNA_END=614 /DNA_ORIENTATION=+